MSRESRAIVFEGTGRPLRLQAFPLPKLKAGEVLVRTLACTLCGSDIHSVEGRRSVAVPTILGHEILGTVEAFGPGVEPRDEDGREIGVGERVTWSVVASCGSCFCCTRDLPQKCEQQLKFGHEAIRPGLELTGGLAEHVLLVAGSRFFRVPDTIAAAVACPANCATATVAAAMEPAGDLTGGRVLILGAGMLGVTAAAWARKSGAELVLVCDKNPSRLDLARAFGASHVCGTSVLDQSVRELTEGRGVDVAVELTGAPDLFEALPGLTRMGGAIVLVGAVFPTRASQIFAEQVVRRCLSIRGTHNYAPRHLKQALTFLESVDQNRFASLVGEWRSLESLDGLRSLPCPANGLRTGIRF